MPLWLDSHHETDLQRVEARRRIYREYLDSIAEFLPPATKYFALSEWYYSDEDKCPHDAWVESLEVYERSSGVRGETRSIHVTIRLLSAWHRGHVFLRYENVIGYHLGCSSDLMSSKEKHGDWMTDEITLASDRTVLHEISFSSGTLWRIRCSSISYEYVPLSPNEPT